VLFDRAEMPEVQRQVHDGNVVSGSLQMSGNQCQPAIMRRRLGHANVPHMHYHQPHAHHPMHHLPPDAHSQGWYLPPNAGGPEQSIDPNMPSLAYQKKWMQENVGPEVWDQLKERKAVRESNPTGAEARAYLCKQDKKQRDMAQKFGRPLEGNTLLDKYMQGLNDPLGSDLTDHVELLMHGQNGDFGFLHSC